MKSATRTLCSGLLALSLQVMPTVVPAADPSIEAAIASPQRTADDRQRDARDKPAEIMAFAGVMAWGLPWQA